MSSGASAGTSGTADAVTTTPSALLAQAQADLARRNFTDALRHTDTLLATPVAPALRAAALLVAGDAGYGMAAYTTASARYGEFVSAYPSLPDAPRAAMSLGWAQYRAGDAHNARLAWTALVNRYPTDARAPLALMLAAEVANQAADASEARVALDRLVLRYPDSPYASAARLSRSIIAIRQQREQDAVRDLDAVIRTAGVAPVEERRRIVHALATAGSELTLQTRPTAPASTGGDGAAEPVERFVATVAARDPADAPAVIHTLVLGAAAEQGWTSPRAGTLAARLVDDYPAYAPGRGLLTRVAQESVTAGQWPMARKAYETLAAHGAPPNGSGNLDFAEALSRTGAPDAARDRLQQVVAAGGPEAPRALSRLAEIDEAAGDRRAALTAYDTLSRDYPRQPRSPESLLAQARLVDEFGPAYRARSLLRAVAENNRGEVAGEAAYRLGRTLSTEGQHRDAAQWYLTATSAAPGSKWEKLGLLGAGDSFVALRDPRRALSAYDRLLHDDDPALRGEASYRVAEIYRAERRHADAATLYLQAAQLTAGSATEPRALVGAVSCLVASGDRHRAETTYQRLVQAQKTTPSDLTAARTALRTESRPDAAEPRAVIKEWRAVDDSSASAQR